MKRYNYLLQKKMLLGVLIFMGVLRFISLGLYPLTDTTEARYAEIARLMAETGNWITPQIDYGVPFWGKPPLSTWLSALSFKFFGVNEFAARLPAFLIGVAIVVLIYCWCRQLKGSTYALTSAVILATTVVFFISSGAVMTDPALMLGTTLSMVAFSRAMSRKSPSFDLWGYLFFVGLAISLLAKGPVGLVMTLLPTGAWILFHRHWKTVFKQLPWITGVLLTCLLSFPWYILAETQTPGFWDYFILGEHWKRFIDAGWQGDLYGSAHARTRGTIWFYWLVSSLPWSLVFIGSFFSRQGRAHNIAKLNSNRELSSYLLFWTITPMIFFTFAGNILWTYVLTGVPAFAMLSAQLLSQQEPSEQQVRAENKSREMLTPAVAIGIAILLSATLFLMTADLVPKRKCQKGLVSTYEQMRSPQDQLVYLFKRPHSAQFYSSGKALELAEITDEINLLKDQNLDFFVVRKRHMSRIPDFISSKLENIGEFNGYYLLRESMPAS